MRYFLLLSILAFSACNQTEPSPKPTEKTNTTAFTILALGDSLTEGLGVEENENYPSQLQRLLPKHIKVINAGLSGETSSGLLNRLDWVLKQKPDLTILTIGANDAMRALPIELTSNNIDKIITKLKQSGSDVILAGMEIYDNLGQEYVRQFKNIYPILARKHNIIRISFFLKHVAGIPQYNQADGLHPNASGYEIIVNRNILPIVENYLENLK